MVLLNLASLTASENDLSGGLMVFAAVTGVLGLAAILGLLRSQTWGGPAVLAVAALNIAGGVVAVVSGYETGVVGIGLGAIAIAVGAIPAARMAHT